MNGNKYALLTSLRNELNDVIFPTQCKFRCMGDGHTRYGRVRSCASTSLEQSCPLFQPMMLYAFKYSMTMT